MDFKLKFDIENNNAILLSKKEWEDLSKDKTILNFNALNGKKDFDTREEQGSS